MLLDDCFRPLIGVIIFQPKYMLSLIKTDQYKFPSPYRGYHLSTHGEQDLQIFWSQYEVSVPLSGLSSFNLTLTNDDYHLVPKVSVPLSGLSSFNRLYCLNYRAYFSRFRPLIGVIIFQRCYWIFFNNSIWTCFRPLIGVIIFQRKYLILQVKQLTVSVPLSGLSSFNQ